MPLFQNKFQTQSARHKNWDYSNSGYYFVTICTKDMQEFFGEIANGEIKLSEIGKIVSEEWLKTGEIRKNVKLDEWIVMPNHIHGIIVIENRRDALNASQNEVHAFPLQKRRPQGVSTDQDYKNKFGPQLNNLSSIIRGFKSASTKRIRDFFPDFQWQSSFYDRIIRNEQALGKIRQYIQRNPKFWNEEKNKVENIFY